RRWYRPAPPARTARPRPKRIRCRRSCNLPSRARRNRHPHGARLALRLGHPQRPGNQPHSGQAGHRHRVIGDGVEPRNDRVHRVNDRAGAVQQAEGEHHAAEAKSGHRQQVHPSAEHHRQDHAQEGEVLLEFAADRDRREAAAHQVDHQAADHRQTGEEQDRAGAQPGQLHRGFRERQLDQAGQHEVAKNHDHQIGTVVRVRVLRRAIAEMEERKVGDEVAADCDNEIPTETHETAVQSASQRGNQSCQVTCEYGKPNCGTQRHPSSMPPVAEPATGKFLRAYRSVGAGSPNIAEVTLPDALAMPGGGSPMPFIMAFCMPGGGSPMPFIASAMPGGGSPMPFIMAFCMPGGGSPMPFIANAMPGGGSPMPFFAIPGGGSPMPFIIAFCIPGGGSPMPFIASAMPGGGSPLPLANSGWVPLGVAALAVAQFRNPMVAASNTATKVATRRTLFIRFMTKGSPGPWVLPKVLHPPRRSPLCTNRTPAFGMTRESPSTPLCFARNI